MKSLLCLIAASSLAFAASFFTASPTPETAWTENLPAAIHLTPVTVNPKKILRAAAAQTPLLRAMEADDVCGVLKEMAKAPPLSAAESPALAAFVGASPAVQELLAKDGPLFGSASLPASRLKSPLARFFYALNKGHLLFLNTDHPGATPADLREARNVLLGLEKEDPSNAAFPFYRLSIEEDLKLPLAARHATLELAAHASRFDLLLTSELSDLQASRFSNAATYESLEYFFSSLNNLGIWRPVTDAQNLERQFPEGNLAALGKLMQQEGFRASRGSVFYAYNDTQFEEGGMLTGEGYVGAHARNSELENLAPGEEWPILYLSTDHCDAAAYRAYFDEVKSRY